MRVESGQNGGIFLATDFGPINNVTIENNLMNGGGFTVWSLGLSSPFGVPTNVRLLNNHFGRNYMYNLLNLQGSVQRSGNVWSDTLQPIPGG